MPNAPIRRPGDGRAERSRDALNSAEFSPTAFATSSRPTISTANDWRVGMSTAFEMPSRAARTITCQTWTTPRRGQPEEDEGQHHRDGLGRDQRLALRELVGDHAAEQAEDDHRPELGDRHEPEPERVVGQLEDEPALGDLLHPGPDERDQLAAEEQPVVAMAEGAGAAGTRSSAGAAARSRRRRRGRRARGPAGSTPGLDARRGGSARCRRRLGLAIIAARRSILVAERWRSGDRPGRGRRR